MREEEKRVGSKGVREENVLSNRLTACACGVVVFHQDGNDERSFTFDVMQSIKHSSQVLSFRL